MDAHRDHGIQRVISGTAQADGTGLTSVPVERLGADGLALRVLQVQIFQLADAIADLSQRVDKLQRSPR